MVQHVHGQSKDQRVAEAQAQWAVRAGLFERWNHAQLAEGGPIRSRCHATTTGPETRTHGKSVSAGNIRYGQLVFRIWSKDQAVTAICSGEAEHSMKLQVDAYAASGIIGRQGLGVVRHLDLSCFWLHQTMQSEESMADIGTTIQMCSILPTESGTPLWRSEHIHHHTTAQHDPFLLSKSYKGQTRQCLDHHSLLN